MTSLKTAHRSRARKTRRLAPGKDRSTAPAAHGFGWLAGGGEMGERMRALNWATTLLGPVNQWPQSLRSAISIMLSSKTQIILFWGEDMITLYNDAYRPFLERSIHGRSAGRRANHGRKSGTS